MLTKKQVTQIALSAASITLFLLFIFGKYKLARAGSGGKILIIGGLVVAATTLFKADASEVPK